MRTIQKGCEPASLTQHRKQANAHYDNYSDKAALRKALVEEQRGLCCYCQSRIRPDAAGMKIEHWQCQAEYPDRQLHYRNLLGACLGGEGRPNHEQHCDTRKGNQELCFNPADPEHNIESRIRFLGDGRIQSSDAEFDRQLTEVLNLNWGRLVRNRKAVLTAFQQRLQTGKKLDPERELPKWDGSQGGELPEFSQVVVYYLNKKLGRGAA
jgi:uncharacterized protein (TIGR02646 family)